MVGDIQAASELEMMSATTSVRKPSAMCQRCRRTMSLNGMEPSSRRCGVQPVSRPNTICSTDPVWMTIMIGAISAAKITSTIEETIEAEGAAAGLARGRAEERVDQAEHLGRQQDAHREDEQVERALVVEPRPVGEARELVREIFRPDVGRLHDEQHADDERPQTKQAS